MIAPKILLAVFVLTLAVLIWLTIEHLAGSDEESIRVISTSQPTVPPLPPAPTSSPGMTTTTTVQVVLVPKARSGPTEVRPARGDVWWRLALCESGGNQRATSKTTPTYYGFFQFDLDSWRRAGGSGDPRDHSYEQQLTIAQRWQRMTGWHSWPTCARRLGLIA